MMKKYGYLVVALLVIHGTVLSMMHTRKIMKNVSRLQLQRRTFGLCGTGDTCGTGLKEFEDVGLLKNQSIEDIKKSLKDIESKLEKQETRLARHDDLLEGVLSLIGDNSISENEKKEMHKARMSYMRQIACIEAMGKIYAMPNLDMYQREHLLNKAERIRIE
jgi:hypothetical protein